MKKFEISFIDFVDLDLNLILTSCPEGYDDDGLGGCVKIEEIEGEDEDV